MLKLIREKRMQIFTRMNIMKFTRMQRHFHSLTVGGNWQNHFGKHLLVYLLKLNVFIPNNLAILLLGIYAIVRHTHGHQKTRIRMFTAALFLIA